MASFQTNTLARSLLTHQRVGMGSWEWEIILIPTDELKYILERPCYSGADYYLLCITADWIRLLHGVCRREWRSSTLQILGREPLAFAALLELVCRLRGLVHLFYVGDPQTVRTPVHHLTFWPHTPRSDVAQARRTIATMIHLGFGTWLDSIPMRGWLPQTSARYHNFAFCVYTGVFGWANANEGFTPRPRMALHLVFPDLDPWERRPHATQEVSVPRALTVAQEHPDANTVEVEDSRTRVPEWLERAYGSGGSLNGILMDVEYEPEPESEEDHASVAGSATGSDTDSSHPDDFVWVIHEVDHDEVALDHDHDRHDNLGNLDDRHLDTDPEGSPEDGSGDGDIVDIFDIELELPIDLMMGEMMASVRAATLTAQRSQRFADEPPPSYEDRDVLPRYDDDDSPPPYESVLEARGHTG
ncbi:hypothetical protein GGS26DRAFT_191605 [Hypomontagnella submonticulosa]|nr:hypothetical protein GGS26DRAFT_191605 [Hypomontagnella submonticulosa]